MRQTANKHRDFSEKNPITELTVLTVLTAPGISYIYSLNKSLLLKPQQRVPCETTASTLFIGSNL